MGGNFYQNPSYKQRQSLISTNNWQTGKYEHLKKPLEMRHCQNPNCSNTFRAKTSNPRKYCSRSCSVTISNSKRTQSPVTRHKISLWLKTHPHFIPRRPHIEGKLVCHNPKCNRNFNTLLYLTKKRKYCSVSCAISVIGGQTTSPKASKGKSGIRKDIDKSICFYSTWEANFARVLQLLKVRWEYAPKVFDLGKHTYRPDFYLPDNNVYIEIKNFMNDYSIERDRSFRKLNPDINLEIISKIEYKQLEKRYKKLISGWES